MQNFDYWRLCDTISIFQAVMLILGYDPANQSSYDVEGHKRYAIPEGYGALKTAIVNAVKGGLIESSIKPICNSYDGDLIENSVDIDETTISIQSLKDFLKQRGFSQGFFFPEGGISEEYIDSQNPYYAPKLAAAVNAWKTITENQSLLNGKTPKQAMQRWLRENASRYGLTKDDGSPNETGIEEICKVANWNTGGGAAKTPTTPLVNDNSPPIVKTQKLMVFGVTQAYSDTMDEEIPF